MTNLVGMKSVIVNESTEQTNRFYDLQSFAELY